MTYQVRPTATVVVLPTSILLGVRVMPKPLGFVKKSAPKVDIDEICEELTRVQRRRTQVIRFRIRIGNMSRSVMAEHLGYKVTMDRAERQRQMKKAQEVIDKIMEGEVKDHPLEHMMSALLNSSDVLQEEENIYTKAMDKLVRQLPIAKWIEEPEQAGVSAAYLGVILGETGNLSNYSCPGKIWKRLGLVPITHGSETLMPSSWNKKPDPKKLPSKVWADFGYSPRRRSVSYVLSEGLLKQNFLRSVEGASKVRIPGPYRAKYDEVRAEAREKHPDWNWMSCQDCKGVGYLEDGVECKDCRGLGAYSGRAKLHAMLLASKLFVRQLWAAWNGKPKDPPPFVQR